MNIIKQIFETPDTPSGKKRLNNLITRLGLGKKVKGDLMKNVVSGELGGGNGNAEVKDWYYTFDGPQFAEDYNLNLNHSSDNHAEEMALLNGIMQFTSPIAKIEKQEVGSKYVPYETLITTIRLFELRRIIYFKYNENYYNRQGLDDSGEHGTVLAIKGSLDERFVQINKMAVLFGEIPDISKYFKITTKEEYDSKLNAKELTIDEVLDLIG